MSANKEIVRHLVDEVWGNRNLEVVDELVAKDYVGHDPTQPEPIQGREGFKKFVGMYQAAFHGRGGHDRRSDRRGRPGRRHAGRGVGTHTGELMGIAPTGKEVTVSGITISRLVGREDRRGVGAHGRARDARPARRRTAAGDGVAARRASVEQRRAADGRPFVCVRNDVAGKARADTRRTCRSEPVSASFAHPPFMPCPACGASVRGRRRRRSMSATRIAALDYELFQLRGDISGLEGEIGEYLSSTQGRFEQWCAEQERRRKATGEMSDEPEP